MSINTIEMKNVKGQTCSQPLTGMDIFVGRNGAGKTTRVQALGAAIMGYVPGNGKRAEDTFKLSTNGAMTVGLQTDHFKFSRTFTRKESEDRKTGEKKVTVSESILVSPGKGEKNDTAKKARILEEIGSFPVMLDFSEFLGLSDARRRDFIYSLSPITSNTWTREDVEKYLDNQMLTLAIKANSPDRYMANHEIITKAMAEYPEAVDIHAGLQSMLDWTSAQLSYWNGKQKDAQGAVRQIAEKKNELEETDRNIIQAKAELEELQQQLIAVEKQISSGTEKKKTADKRTIKIAELQSIISKLEESPVNNDTAALDQQIKDLQGQITPPVDTEAETAEIKKKLAEAKKQLKVLTNERMELNSQITTIRTQVKTIQDAVAKTGELAGKCTLHQQISCPKDWTGLDSFAEKKKAEGEAKTAELTAKVEELNLQIKALEAESEALEDKREAAVLQAQKANSQNTVIQNKITAMEREKNKVLSDAEKYTNQLNMHKTELIKLMNEPAEGFAPVDIQEKQAEGIRSRITELKLSVEEKEKAKQTILLLQQSMIENTKAEYMSLGLKSLSQALGPKGIQGELVKEILEPIRSDISGNLQLMGFNQTPFFQTESDTGKEIFQFGWVNEKGHRVNFDALSTGQQTVFLAAMTVTILDRANPKLKILVMDDLNHLDRQNFQMLINGLSKLSDKLDNIILAGAIEFSFEADRWKVWDLSSPVSEVSQSA